MIRKEVKNLKGGEYLARPVLLNSNSILIYEGTRLKKDYIEKLIELGVYSVYIKEPAELEKKEYSISELQIDLRDTYRNNVKELLEKHTPVNTKDLTEFVYIAEDIINEVLNHEEVVYKMADIREGDPDIYEHSITVCALAVIIAIRADVDKKKMHHIAAGGLLHDLGLRYISSSYENIDIEEMNSYARNEFKKHSIYGYSALEKEDWLSKEAKTIILAHHERLEGRGYPLKLKKIGIENRIVGICDSFDCMIRGIGYKKRKVYEAVEEIKGNMGILFDKKIADTFIDFIAIYPVGTKVRTNEGEIGIVVRQNEHFKERPVIRILYDKFGNKLDNGIEKDMLKILDIFIAEIL